MLGHIRSRLAARNHILIAHRYLTRKRQASENHIALSPAEFAIRKAGELFTSSWHAHGSDYGIGIEVTLWAARGFDVLVNGSREAFARRDEANTLGPAVKGVWLTAQAHVRRRRRRLGRGRETPAQLEGRLKRALEFPAPPNPVTIHNDGPIEEAAGKFLALLRVR